MGKECSTCGKIFKAGYKFIKQKNKLYCDKTCLHNRKSRDQIYIKYLLCDYCHQKFADISFRSDYAKYSEVAHFNDRCYKNMWYQDRIIKNYCICDRDDNISYGSLKLSCRDLCDLSKADCSIETCISCQNGLIVINSSWKHTFAPYINDKLNRYKYDYLYQDKECIKLKINICSRIDNQGYTCYQNYLKKQFQNKCKKFTNLCEVKMYPAVIIYNIFTYLEGNIFPLSYIDYLLRSKKVARKNKIENSLI